MRVRWTPPRAVLYRNCNPMGRRWWVRPPPQQAFRCLPGRRFLGQTFPAAPKELILSRCHGGWWGSTPHHQALQSCPRALKSPTRGRAFYLFFPGEAPKKFCPQIDPKRSVPRTPLPVGGTPLDLLWDPSPPSLKKTPLPSQPSCLCKGACHSLFSRLLGQHGQVQEFGGMRRFLPELFVVSLGEKKKWQKTVFHWV